MFSEPIDEKRDSLVMKHDSDISWEIEEALDLEHSETLKEALFDQWTKNMKKRDKKALFK